VRPSSEFLPLLEREESVVELGEWVVREALRAVERWSAAGVHLPGCVPISGAQFRGVGFAERMARVAREVAPTGGVPLCLRVAEVAVARDPVAASRIADALRRAGLRLVLADFSAGKVPLANLQHLALTGVRVPAALHRGLAEHPGRADLVRGIVAGAGAMGLEVAADAVDDRTTRAELLAVGCRVMSGAAVGTPMSIAEIEARLAGPAVPAERVLGGGDE
jgi:EAL domain-containing protein (putative c-di-GMP-specific phosphodiesterase class I)